jgi:stalled ribosome rescue protein Dom34
MSTRVGLWIDHKRAVLVFLTGKKEEIKEIASDMEKHVRFSGDQKEDGGADDLRDRQYAAHLNRYYDEVIAAIGDADSILIFGPGEAKGELAKRLESKGLKHHLVGKESADKMTDPQIAARVREHFLA